MRTRSKIIPVAAAIAAVLVLGSCSRTFGVSEDAADDTADTTTTTKPYAGSSTTAHTGTATDTKPTSSKTTTKPDTSSPKDDGFDGNPPSFPAFTFTATRGADGNVRVSGSGCAGGKVSLYPEASDSGEGGDPHYANPDAAGNWSVTARFPAGQLTGTCFGVGSSGQSHVGGSLTVTVP